MDFFDVFDEQIVSNCSEVVVKGIGGKYDNSNKSKYHILLQKGYVKCKGIHHIVSDDEYLLKIQCKLVYFIEVCYF